MRFATIGFAGRTAVAAIDLEARRARLLPDSLGAAATDMVELIRLGACGAVGLYQGGEALALESVSMLAPIPRPRRNIFCVGKNYHEHAKEFSQSGFDTSQGNGGAIPDAPIIFSKVPECVVGPNDAVRLPEGAHNQVDYEAELAVVIGIGGRQISRARAYDHVWGYTLLNDVTARDLQARHKQWLIGKSLDTFAPMGPWLVTADEVDPENLTIRCWVNGDLRQEACTRDLIFDIPTIIEAISNGITLYPGDIIATGTPAGVGIGFSPPRFLRRGDRVDIEINGIGRLSNSVV